MSVLDNVMVGAHSRTRSGFLASALRVPSVGREEAAQREAALEAIRFMGLEAVAHLPAAGLPFATLKRVEAARALAAKPKLLLMDEPAGGLNHEEVAVLGALIRTIRDRLGITILLVEHHMSLVMEVSDKVVVLDFGKRIAEGSAGRGTAESRSHQGLSRENSVGAILEVEKLEAFYGRTQALHGVSFAMEEGGITTVLGANGAGKTTTLRAISAMVKTRGSIRFGGKPIEAKATEQIVAIGHRARAGGTRHLRRPHRGGESPHRHVRAARQAPRRARHGARARALPDPPPSGDGSSPARSPAASSRCSRWRGR